MESEYPLTEEEVRSDLDRLRRIINYHATNPKRSSVISNLHYVGRVIRETLKLSDLLSRIGKGKAFQQSLRNKILGQGEL